MSEERNRMRTFIEKHWWTNRTAVSEATNAVARDAAEILGGTVQSHPSGSECLTWVIPQQWELKRGRVIAPNGDVVADADWNPLYIRALSPGFCGTVSRDELMAHVLTDPDRPERITYDYRQMYGFRPELDWGVSLPHERVEALPDGDYHVEIDAELFDGAMEIVDHALPGECDQTVFFGAHTCHPAMVNDGLACVAVILELMRWLAELPNRRYTYRAILGPEYFAAAAALAREQHPGRLIGGLYLDMLGNGQPLACSRPFGANTYIYEALRQSVHASDLPFKEYGYREAWGNDEMFYDGPDFQIPTPGVAREWWPHYHTELDNLENLDMGQLSESLEILKGFVTILEGDAITRRTYTGPLYLNRFDLYIDPRTDPQGYRRLQDIQILMDGTRSDLQIAAELNITNGFVHRFSAGLTGQGLADREPVAAERTTPAISDVGLPHAGEGSLGVIR